MASLKPIPLFGQSLNAYSPGVSRQRRLNCFYDIRSDGDKSAVVIRGTPGSARFVTLPTFPIRGWRAVGAILYVVAGSVLYSVTTTGIYTAIGVMTNSTSMCSIADNGLQLLIVDGSKGYVYTIVTGVYTQAALNNAGSFGAITDANFPNGATSTAFLDGWGIVNRPASRQAYVTGATYDFTNWTNVSSLPSFFTKENSSDLLVAVEVLNGTIILWGASTTEFWQDVGSSPQPFARVTGATQTWGLAAVNSRADLNNSVAFLGQNPQGGVQVMTLNGYVPTRVSTSDIENILASFTTVADATALTYIVDGHPMYQLNFPTAGRSFLYDALTSMWSEVQTGLALIARHYGNLGVAFNTENFIADYSSGNIYQLRTDVYTDNGNPIKRVCASRHIHADGDHLTIARLWLDIETGVGTQGGQGSNPQIMLRVSKDNGHTFPVERWVSIGAVGQYKAPRAIWRRLGTSTDFVFEFVMTDPVKFSINKGSAATGAEEG